MKRAVSALVGALLLLACNDKPAPGELIVLLSSDMQVPDSFDTVILTAGNVRRVYRHDPGTVPATQDADADCKYTEQPNEQPLALPASVSIISDKDRATSLQDFRVIACKSGKLVFSDRVEAMLPEPGQVRMIRAPIRWLCAARIGGCYECKTPPCHHGAIERTDAAKCLPDVCRDHTGEAFGSVDFDPAELATYESKATSCFDPGRCFTTAADPTSGDWTMLQMPVRWRDSTVDDSTPCIGTLPSERDSKVNLALVVPRDARGYCNRARCLVPLDTDPFLGWSSDATDPTRILFPRVICQMLDSGQILYVVRSENCPSKTPGIPICGADSDQAALVAADDSTPGDIEPILYFPLNFSEDVSPLKTFTATDDEQTLEPNEPFVMADDIKAGDIYNAGLNGDRAVRFNSHHYARSANPIVYDDLSVSAWVSLENYVESLEPTLPIVSNLSSDCTSGLRLELRVCDDPTKTVLAAVGHPSPLEVPEPGRCKLDFVYAPFSRNSYIGGFFTPWHAGNWYHLFATVEDGITKLYVDGTRADQFQPPPGCLKVAPTEVAQSHDDSQLYIGGNAAASASENASRDVLIDDVKLFDHALAVNDVARLKVMSQSQPGASGLRWGTWGTQGTEFGYTTIGSDGSDLVFGAHDDKYSSTGAFALLSQPQDIRKVTGFTSPPDLSNFDEAVLVITGQKYRQKWQFALMSAHGLRQCTWQLPEATSTQASTTSAADTLNQREAFIIDLHRPSWCVSPDLTFDMHHVEQVSIGSDWKDGDDGHVYTYKVNALAFRRRLAKSASGPQGGVIGPSGWYWKSVSYDPGWEPQPVTQVTKSDGPTPVQMQKAIMYQEGDVPELAADLPDNERNRDFRRCSVMQVCFGITESMAGDQDGGIPKLVIQNEHSQTLAVSLPKAGDCPAKVALDAQGALWPQDERKPSLDNVLSSVTRLSIRSSGNVQVDYVKCCDANGTCTDI